MKKFTIALLIFSLVLSVPWGGIAHAQETYVRKTVFDADEFILGLLMGGAGIYVFCLTWTEAEEKDEEVELKWGYAVLGTLMMLVGANCMANAWAVKVEKVSRGNDERTYLLIGRKF